MERSLPKETLCISWVRPPEGHDLFYRKGQTTQQMTECLVGDTRLELMTSSV